MAVERGRPYLIVCDGRGSASLSHLGATAAVARFGFTCRILEPLLSRCLDDEEVGETVRRALWKTIGAVLLDALMSSQTQLANEHKLPASEFEHTVSAVIFGTVQCGAIQLGDSCIAAVRGETAQLVFAPQTGEYASETHFVEVSSSTQEKACFDLLDTSELSAVFAFTDGVFDRWVQRDSLKLAGCVRQIATKLGSGEWTEKELCAYLEHPEIWSHIDDDRCVAYVVRAGAASEQTASVPETN